MNRAGRAQRPSQRGLQRDLRGGQGHEQCGKENSRRESKGLVQPERQFAEQAATDKSGGVADVQIADRPARSVAEGPCNRRQKERRSQGDAENGKKSLIEHHRR
jgi:hypothetical protein